MAPPFFLNIQILELEMFEEKFKLKMV